MRRGNTNWRDGCGSSERRILLENVAGLGTQQDKHINYPTLGHPVRVHLWHLLPRLEIGHEFAKHALQETEPPMN